MDTPLSVILCRHAVKLGLGIFFVVILSFITSDIHAMAACMLKSTPIDWVTNAPPPQKLNCTAGYFRPDLDLKVEVCRGYESSMVTFYLTNATLRSYSTKDSTELVDWLRRCSGPVHGTACPLFSTGRSDFPSYTPLSFTVYMCHHNNSMNLVIHGIRLSKKESNDVLAFLLR